MIRFKPLLIMSVVTIATFACLIMLGRWQWERYEMKSALADEPVPMMTIENYQPLPDGIQFVYGVRSDTREAGWRVFAPVQEGESTIFVDADFIASATGAGPPNADEVRVPASLRLGAPISGASIRPNPPSPFAGAPEPLRRLWFAIDLPAMGRNIGVDQVSEYYIAGAYVGTDGRATPNPFARAPGADDLPPARHMGYAITWYGLALVLIVIYFAYHVSVGRLSFAPPRPPEA
ncbi:SURF1 family cytochrome oxidase biogenesis protein [Terricaulis sp.]|uniref:SURF1 family cytochrome oxidase biogenesis protein n=1 Tax=Terricaulis sp. TaxID=2768686 RepID=UPI002AC37493|nr:SURF1 family cytochrome oxidase biogenesis protein [Terricaulis sp.]MDZ4693020.1 SURF1 family cytochrome oxidase biogenesis protein [Terricaulis sp.]